MAKFKPGIPDDFSFDVAPVSDLGDYLDEPSPLPQRKPRPAAVERGEGTTAPWPTEATEPVAPLLERTAIPPVSLQATVPPPVVARPAPHEPPPIVLREDRVIPQAPPAAAPRDEAVNEDRLPKS